MATEVVSTIRASGGDYSSLSAWEAGEQADLVTADEIAVAECYNDWASGLSDSVTVSGWTVDSTRRIIIRAASADGTQGPSKHGGIPGAGFYITHSTDHQMTVTVSVLHTLISGIEARHTGRATAFRAIENTNDLSIVFDGCIGSQALGLSGYAAFELKRGTVRNSLAIDSAIGFYSGYNYYGSRFYNNKAINCTTGVVIGTGTSSSDISSSAIKNTLAYGCTTNWSVTASGIRTGHVYNNASGDYAGDPPPGTSPYTSDVVSSDFVDAANDDFHIAASSALKTAGANLYSDFQYDIDGDEYPSTGDWPIGFDYVAGGGGVSYDETFTASALTGFVLSNSWSLNYAESFSASATTGATLTDAYDTPSVNYDETFSASAVTSCVLTAGWELAYTETFAAASETACTLTDAWLLDYAEAFAVQSAAGFDLTATWALDYAETLASSAVTACDMAHSYAVGNDYTETFAATSVTVCTLTHSFSVQYSETFAAQAATAFMLADSWALGYAETLAASSATGCALSETYETPAPGAFDETFAAASVADFDLTHAFSTPADIGRIINPTLAARGAPVRTLKGSKLIN